MTWRPFWTHFGPFSSIEGQNAYLRLEHCDIATIETSETSTLCVETGQMSAAETGQMSAVETRQMYSIKTGQRPVAIADICLVSTCTSEDRKAH